MRSRSTSQWESFPTDVMCYTVIQPVLSLFKSCRGCSICQLTLDRHTKGLCWVAYTTLAHLPKQRQEPKPSAVYTQNISPSFSLTSPSSPTYPTFKQATSPEPSSLLSNPTTNLRSSLLRAPSLCLPPLSLRNKS